jgi:hypothetical protein
MFNDRSLWEIARAQQKETLAWAQKERLLKEAINHREKTDTGPSLWQQTLWKVGDWSIAFGHWLKQKPIL